MFYYFSQRIDEDSETDLTLFRSTSPNIKQLGTFGNYREKHGLEAAMPLFRQISYHWAVHSTNPIGDIMSTSIFSPRAAELISEMRGEYDIFEPINVEGTQAVYVATKRHLVDELSVELDFFSSKKYRISPIVVSERFKTAWEAAGLIGAEFEPITADSY